MKNLTSKVVRAAAILIVGTIAYISHSNSNRLEKEKAAIEAQLRGTKTQLREVTEGKLAKKLNTIREQLRVTDKRLIQTINRTQELEYFLGEFGPFVFDADDCKITPSYANWSALTGADGVITTSQNPDIKFVIRTFDGEPKKVYFVSDYREGNQVRWDSEEQGRLAREPKKENAPRIEVKPGLEKDVYTINIRNTPLKPRKNNYPVIYVESGENPAFNGYKYLGGVICLPDRETARSYAEKVYKELYFEYPKAKRDREIKQNLDVLFPKK